MNLLFALFTFLAVAFVVYRWWPAYWFRRKIIPRYRHWSAKLGVLPHKTAPFIAHHQIEGYHIYLELYRNHSAFAPSTLRVIIPFIPEGVAPGAFRQWKESQLAHYTKERGSAYRLYITDNEMVLDYALYRQPPDLKAFLFSLNVQTLWLETHNCQTASMEQARAYAQRMG